MADPNHDPWDWTYEAPGWNDPSLMQPPPPQDVAPEGMLDAPQDDYSNTPVPDNLPQEVGRYGVPIASGGISAPPAPDAPLPPEASAAPPGLPPLPPSGEVTTDKNGVPQAPDQSAQLAAAHQGEVQANQQLYDAQQADEDARNAVTAQGTQDQRDVELDSMAREHTVRRDQAAAMDAANQKVAAAEQAVREIDPDHFWTTKSTGQKVAMMISAAIGGYYAPYHGGQNSTIDEINKAIDRDIHAQTLNQSKDEFMVGQAEKARAGVKEKYGDLLDDVNLQRAGRLRAAILDQQAKMASIKSPVTQAKGQAMLAQLNNAYVDRLSAAHQTEVDNKFKEFTANSQVKAARAAAGAQAAAQRLAIRNQALEDAKAGATWDPKTQSYTIAPKPLNPEDELKRRKLLAETEGSELANKQNAGKLTVIDAITGETIGEGVDEKRSAKANQAQLDYQRVAEKIDRLHQLRDQIGTTVNNRFFRGDKNDKLVAEYNVVADDLGTAIAKLADPDSSVRESEKAGAMKLIPQFSTVLGPGSETAAGQEKAIITNAQQRVGESMKAAKLPFDAASYFRNAKKGPDSPAQSAMKAATAYVPAPPGAPGTLSQIIDEPVPSTPLLAGVQASVPVQAMEHMAARGDKKAFQYLQAVAADQSNPEVAAQADAALARLGVK